jgi:hypothetical protein
MRLYAGQLLQSLIALCMDCFRGSVVSASLCIHNPLIFRLVVFLNTRIRLDYENIIKEIR